MLEFVINCILWIFAIYGFIQFFKLLIEQSVHKRIENNGIYVIIAAKNQEQQIEMFLRAVIYKIIHGKGEYLKNIIATDLDSIDNTKEILEKFSKDYDEIKVVDWKSLKNKLDNLE